MCSQEREEGLGSDYTKGHHPIELVYTEEYDTIHRHRQSSETVVIVRGSLIERFYDDNGNITDEFVMAPLSIPS